MCFWGNGFPQRPLKRAFRLVAVQHSSGGQGRTLGAQSGQDSPGCIAAQVVAVLSGEERFQLVQTVLVACLVPPIYGALPRGSRAVAGDLVGVTVR